MPGSHLWLCPVDLQLRGAWCHHPPCSSFPDSVPWGSRPPALKHRHLRGPDASSQRTERGPRCGRPREADARSNISGGGAGPANRTLFRRSRQTMFRMILKLHTGMEGKDAVIAWCCLPRGCFVVADPRRIVSGLQRHRRIHTGTPRRVQAQLQATVVKQVSQ